MKRHELEELMINLASKEHTVTGGQAAFEFAWEMVDRLETVGVEIKFARIFVIDENLNTLALGFDNNKFIGSITIDANDEEKYVTAGFSVLVRKDYDMKDRHAVLFSDLDRKQFLDEFSGVFSDSPVKTVTLPE